jgi:hypothetical protein
MKKIVFYLFLIQINFNCQNSSQNSSQNYKNIPPKSISSISNSDNQDDVIIDLRNLLADRKFSADSVVYIKYDPFFRSEKRYIGFDLRDIVTEALNDRKIDTSDAIAIFECTDGYRSTMRLSHLFKNYKGTIAVRDLSAPAGKYWPDSLEQKFSPYYLVWSDVPQPNHYYSWPYGLTTIRIASGIDEFKNSYPVNSPEYSLGFYLIRDHCLNCHSVNKEGGLMAPEFNIPKNITEYWKDEDIIAFAKKPNSYRYNAKMPPISTITDSEFYEIVRYLKFIAEYKVKVE